MSRKTNNKKMLYQLEKEIKKLEYDVNHAKLKNIEIRALRNLKIALRTGQLIAPYAATWGIIFGIFSALGNVPFVRDDVKQNLQTKKFDSLGNVRYEEQYAKFKDTKWTLFYTDKWQDVGEGLYAREVKKYEINSKMTEDAITKVVNDNDVSSLDELLGKPRSSYVEKKNNLTISELEEDACMRAIIYSTDINDYIVVKESVNNNIGGSFVYIFFDFISSLAIYGFRKTLSSFDYKDCIYNIKRSNPKVDVETLKKKLELKKSNYERLTR